MRKFSSFSITDSSDPVGNIITRSKKDPTLFLSEKHTKAFLKGDDEKDYFDALVDCYYGVLLMGEGNFKKFVQKLKDNEAFPVTNYEDDPENLHGRAIIKAVNQYFNDHGKSSEIWILDPEKEWNNIKNRFPLAKLSSNLQELAGIEIDIIAPIAIDEATYNECGNYITFYDDFYGCWERNPFFGSDSPIRDMFRISLTEEVGKPSLYSGFNISKKELIALGSPKDLLSKVNRETVRLADNNTSGYFFDPEIRLLLFRLIAQHLNEKGKACFYTIAYLAKFISKDTFEAIKENMMKLYGEFIVPEIYKKYATEIGFVLNLESTKGRLNPANFSCTTFGNSVQQSSDEPSLTPLTDEKRQPTS